MVRQQISEHLHANRTLHVLAKSMSPRLLLLLLFQIYDGSGAEASLALDLVAHHSADLETVHCSRAGNIAHGSAMPVFTVLYHRYPQADSATLTLRLRGLATQPFLRATPSQVLHVQRKCIDLPYTCFMVIGI